MSRKSRPYYSCNTLGYRALTLSSLDCTPKAIENRLYSWKKKNTSAGATTATTSAPSTPAKTDGPKQKTPRSRVKSTPRVKKEKTEDEDENEEPSSPTPARRKRKAGTPKKASSKEKESGNEDVEEEDGPKSKKVKNEPTDDDSGVNETASDEGA